MKKIILFIICLFCLFVSFQFLTGCKQKETDITDIKKWKVVIEDPLATPNRVETKLR